MGHPATTSDGNTYAPSPGAFPPTPRAVRVRRLPYLLLLGALLWASVGIFLVLVSTVPLFLSLTGKWLGETAPGRVTDKSTRGKGKRTCVIHYAYQVNDRDYHFEMEVDAESFERVQVGDPVVVRVAPVVHRISTIESPKLSRSWNTYCFLLFAAMWNGMLVWMVWMVLRDAQSWRRLASHGTAVLGRITDKQMVHSRGWKYILTYRFPGDGAEQEATMWVRRRDFEAIQVGQPVTVVFDPADPKNSLIYRCGEYAVVGLD